MKRFLAFLFIVFSFTSYGQAPEPNMLWLKTYGGAGADRFGSNVVSTPDGGFILLLSTDSPPGPGNIDSFCTMSGDRGIFIKCSADASTVEWTKCFMSTADTAFYYLYPQTDGGFVCSGNYTSTVGGGYYISKLDALGGIIWSHGYSKGNSLYMIGTTTTDDGGYVIAGPCFYVDTNATIHYGGTLDADIFVMRLDSAGNKVWATVIGGTGDDEGNAIVNGPGDGCYVAGATTSNDHDCIGNHGGSDVFVARLDKGGNILWHRDYGGSADDGVWKAVADGKGGIIIGADTKSLDGDISHPIDVSQNLWIADIDSNGTMVWNNCYGDTGSGYCYLLSICRATDGSVWVGAVCRNKRGEIDTSYGRDDAWFVHIDTAGNLINAKVLGSRQDDAATLVCPLSNGNILVGGYYDTAGGAFPDIFYGGGDAFLAEFSPTSLSVPDFIQGWSLNIYPNPATTDIEIVLPKNESGNISIINEIGQTVYRKQLLQQAGYVSIIIDEWNSGVYFIEWNGAGGTIQTAKFIKM